MPLLVPIDVENLSRPLPPLTPVLRPPPVAKHQHWLQGAPSPPPPMPLQTKAATEGKAAACLVEPHSARPHPNWKRYPHPHDGGAPVLAGYPHVAMPKAGQRLMGPPPKRGQPQAAEPGQPQAAEEEQHSQLPFFHWRPCLAFLSTKSLQQKI